MYLAALSGVKSADQIITAHTTLINDADMRFAVAANSVYEFHVHIRYASPSGGDWKSSFTVPSGAVAHFQRVGLNASGAFAGGFDSADTDTISSQGQGASTVLAADFFGFIDTASTAGNLIFQWAQLTSQWGQYHPLPEHLPDRPEDRVTRTMRDSTTARDIRRHGLDLAAGYGNGTFRWHNSDWALFPGIPHVHIDVNGTDPGGSGVLDVENGDATPATAVKWVKARKAALPGAYAVVYCDRSTLDARVQRHGRGRAARGEGLPFVDLDLGRHQAGHRHDRRGGRAVGRAEHHRRPLRRVSSTTTTGTPPTRRPP